MGRALAIVVILAGLVGAAAWFTAAEEAVACAAGGAERIEYQYAELAGVDSERNRLDVHAVPGARHCPVVLWVHGGSWQAGDKRSRSTGVKADHYTSQGYVFVSTNYRLASEDNEVRWPDFGLDIATAVDWVIANADRIGADADHITLVGHSAGAHLVSVVATNPELLANVGRDLDAVQCAVSLDSVTHDLTDPPPWEVDIIELGFPTLEQKVDGSPSLQTTSMVDAASILIVTRGRIERIDSSHRLALSVERLGGSAEVVDVSPYDHGEVSTMLGVAGESIITPVVDDFLDTCRSGAAPRG